MNRIQENIQSLLVVKAVGDNISMDVTNKKLSLLKREDVTVPVIYIGAGTCGLGAGAAKTLEGINSYLSNKKINAEVIEVGCIGLCAAEPIVDIQLPGHNRIAFGGVTGNKIDELLEAVFNLEIPKSIAPLYQFPIAEKRSWEGVTHFNKHPYFEKQQRIVLQNCGTLNPVSIDEYIATGGYQSYLNTINTYEPEQVCNMVVDSG